MAIGSTEPGLRHTVLVGVSAALIGFTSSAVVVLEGLRAVGATPHQATVGLMALCVLMGALCIGMSHRYRLPITFAWSTPGAAVLIAAGTAAGGWASAIGAFLICGVLLTLTALIPGLGTLIGRIPTPIAQAMLAGVLLTICLGPVQNFGSSPALIGILVVTWLVLQRFAARWATPAAFALAMILIAVTAAAGGDAISVSTPRLDWALPSFSLAATLNIALPLYLVTVAAQHIPGVAVISSYGHRVPWRPVLLASGLGTTAGAMFGAHAVNLAAITAAPAASPEAHADPARRWVAAATTGWTYLVLTPFVPVFVGLAQAAPDGVVGTVAAVGLLGTLGGAMIAAVADEQLRIPAVITFIVAASSVVIAGVSSMFWALVCGIVAHVILSPRRGARNPTG